MGAVNLALYKYDSCGYCARVIRTIEALDMEDEVEMRDVLMDPDNRQDLFDARGRGTVPVLRIEDEEGNVQWMGESREIVAWLEARFG